MDKFFSPYYSWGNFISIGLFLLLLYFILLFFKNMLDKFQFLGAAQPTVNKSVHYLLLVYEPVGLLLLASIFILIDPKVHGIFALLIGIFGSTYIKSYISGRFIQRDRNLVKGKGITANNLSGVIYDMEQFGLQLQTNKGLHFVSYSKMLSEGYTLLTGDEVGGFFNLIITSKDTETKVNHVDHLMDIFVSTPYINRNQKPVLVASQKNPNKIEARVSLKEESHLQELMALINEWGYASKLLKTDS